MNPASPIHHLLERHYAAWTAGDIEGVVACYTDDCEFEDLAMEAKFDGKEGVRNFATLVNAAIPDFRWIPKHFSVDGSRCSAEWQMYGTQSGDLPGIPGTGKTFDVRGLSALEIKDGKIHRNRDYWSLATYMRQLGLMDKAA